MSLHRSAPWPAAAALTPGRQGLLLMAAFGLTWVVAEGVVGALLAGRYPLMQIVWCRYATHLVLMLVVWRALQPTSLWRTRRPGFHLARSLLMLVMPLSFDLAIHRVGTDIGWVWAVFWVSPLMIMALAQFWLRERAPWTVWCAAGLACLGAMLMQAPYHWVELRHLALPALMALSFSLYVVMTRSLRDEPVQVNLFYTAVGVFLALTPFMPAIWVMPGWRDAACLVAIGAGGLLGLLALDRAAHAAPVAMTAGVLPLQLLWLAALELSMHAQPLSRRLLAGMVVLCIAAAWLWLRESRVTAAPAGAMGAHPEPLP